MPRADVRVVTSGPEVREKILKGMYLVADVASATYGATSSNVAVALNYGKPNITKDGVTAVRDLASKDEIEDLGIGLLVEASEKSNSTSGDGTTCTCILGYNIMNLANQRIAAGYSPFALRKGIDKAAIWIKQELDNLSVTVKDEDLAKVAGISASDPEIGKLVADVVKKTGGVGVSVEFHNALGVIQDTVEGFHFDKGWTMSHFVTDRTSEEAVHEDIAICVLEKKITQNQDIIPILELVHANVKSKTVLFIGNVDGQASETCALTNLTGKIKVCVVKPPVYGDQELPFLEDVAAMTGAKVIPGSLPADKVTANYLGLADKVTVTKDTTTILGGKGNKKEIAERISDLKEQLKSDKYNAFQKERMELRLSKLQGKIGIIRVGGATESEAKEMKYRVEDAIAATRAAKEEGIVPGGATTLARLSKMDSDEADPSEQQGCEVVFEALAEPFKQLMANAGEDGGYRLRQVLKSKKGYGFNVKEMSEEPIDLLKAGILDPTKVLKSVVENACAAAGLAITIPVHIGYDRAYQIEQIQINKLSQQ